MVRLSSLFAPRFGPRPGPGRPVLSMVAAVALLAGVLVAAAAVGAPVPRASAVSEVAPQGRPYPAYYLVATDGGIFDFGGAPFYGSMGGRPLNRPVVAMAVTEGGGYWEVASDGGIFSFNAPFFGSMGGRPLNQPIVGMAADSRTGGYWEVASDGGIFSFNAPFFGSMGGRPLNQPIVGMAATPDGQGYWMVASDGGIFAFGDASFYGSTGSIHLNKPIVGMTSTASGGGYILVASDGGIFAYGDAQFYGSLGGAPLSRPIIGMAESPAGAGYWFADDNGAVTAEGTRANYWGSAPQVINQPVVGMAATWGSGGFAGLSYQSGAYGYDVSTYQCSSLPSGHTIGIVQANGWGLGAPNPCLAQEAAWAGGGLNLYTYLSSFTYAADGTPNPACATLAACAALGANEATYAFSVAAQAGVDTAVTWWLDVEGTGGAFVSGNTVANQALVQGAITGLRSEGINNVGIYSSADNWPSYLGTWDPGVPLWIAWYTGSGPGVCNGARAQSGNTLPPNSPIVMAQYDDVVNGQSVDGDYAC